MLTGVRSKIDSMWSACWSAGISNPLTIVEQITLLLFIRRLEVQFSDEHKEFRWSHLKGLAPQTMFDTVSLKLFPFICSGCNGAKWSVLARFMKGASFMIPHAQLLSKLVEKISTLDLSDQDLMGDLYEYLLSKLSTAGIQGQFRTPGHIQEFIINVVSPTLNDIVCDPAVGTAGFLTKSIQYFRKHYSTDELKKKLTNQMFYGKDVDTSMLRISAMNMVLHSIDEPNLSYVNALSEENHSDREKYSLILANPPFAGVLDYKNVAKDLLIHGKTKKTELLFLSLFISMLRTGGRCACIVPDGVLFGSSKAHRSIRATIIDSQRLVAVISMPSGVFKPYTGVSTAVLYFHKTDSGGTDKVWFYDMQADGFSLDDKRTPLDTENHKTNNIPDILKRVHNLESEEDRNRTEQSFMVPVEEIRANGYDLSINRYKEIVHEEISYDPPGKIIAELAALETEIQSGLDELGQLIEGIELS